MTENRNGLARREQEFVGVGASVGAGCHPCLTHHVKAGAEAGIEAAGLLAAIAAAERVTADASARMAQHARRELLAADRPVTGADAASEATLAALGAAVAANSMPNIERYLSEAAELGLSHDELVDAVRIAHEVQANAARIHAARTTKLLEAPLRATAPRESQHPVDTCDEACPCHDGDLRADGVAGATVSAAPSRQEPSRERTCADAACGQDEPAAAKHESSQPDNWGGMGPMMADTASARSRTMLAGCCETTSA